MRAEEVVEEVKARLRPSPEERRRADGVAARALEAASRALADLGLRGEARLGGSYAHDTWLAGHADVDVFLLLEPGTDLEAEGLRAAERALELAGAGRVERRYAEHPYMSGEVEGIRVEVVPCYRVPRGSWMSAADRSPYHTEYLLGRLNDPLRDEIRATKAFMRAQGIYGAEIKVRGFSGYLVEVLTLSYGNLVGLMRAAASWRPGEVVSPEPLQAEVAAIHRGALLVVPDPVDQRRNLGAAVSAWSLGRFVVASEMFLEEPDTKFFEEPIEAGSPLGLEDVARDSLAVVIRKPEKPEDILWGEVWRTMRGLAGYLRSRGFEVLASAAGEDDDSVAMAFLLDSLECCRHVLRRGPHVLMAGARRRFLESSRGRGPVWTGEDGYLYSVRSSGGRIAREELRRALEDPVRLAGAARGLEEELRSAEVLEGEEVMRGRESARRGLVGIASGRPLV
ncbi:MAG: CCA tRNA nucleotidyltransferase [Conexivisphaera sp.]